MGLDPTELGEVSHFRLKVSDAIGEYKVPRFALLCLRNLHL